MPQRLPDDPHTLSASSVASALETVADSGLTSGEAAARRKVHGPNLLTQMRPRSILAILVHQFKSVVVLLLAAATVISYTIGDYAEAMAVLVVLAINGAIGVITEWRAARSMEALRHLAETRTRVRRDGRVAAVDARDLVPGDIVLLEAGDLVTADLRLLKTSRLQCDESVLTGESAPVDKTGDPVPPGTVLADRTCMAYKGTAITRGSAEAVVTGTGMNSEIGRISALVQDAKSVASPLEDRLNRLGQKLIWLMLGLSALTIAAGFARGRAFVENLQTGVALAVAAVPEGLPVVASLCLARGMWRMMRKNALINRLSAVETLGATTLILTDKTGTLTENRMTVIRYIACDGDLAVPSGGSFDAPGGGVLDTALRIGVLSSSAEAGGDDGGDGVGDPMELALLAAAARAGIVQDRSRVVAEQAFDPASMMMSQVHAEEDGHFCAVKGAPEAVAAASSHVLTPEGLRPLDDGERERWLARVSKAAAEGLRCLALAMKRGPHTEGEVHSGLTLVAFVALADPIRADVPAAIDACRRAGIKVVMVTGDHRATAARIARDAGIGDHDAQVIEGRELLDFDPAAAGPADTARLLQADVFARVAPETKMALVTFFQLNGHVVAMTGDGVNDAPALAQAEIGIAMGHRGTQVAREAADMVLLDDSFPTIVAAVREGRTIFENLRKFVVYLMSCNVSEVLVVGLAVGVGLPAPLLPLQILFLNLVTDVFPAFALGLGHGSGDLLTRPPRAPGEPIMGRREWLAVGWLGAAITVATLMSFVLAFEWLDLGPSKAVTVAFLTLALAQLWNVFNMRERGSRAFASDEMHNPFVFGAIGLCVLLIGAALLIPGLSDLLQLPFPGVEGLALGVVLSLCPTLAASLVLSRPARVRR